MLPTMVPLLPATVADATAQPREATMDWPNIQEQAADWQRTLSFYTFYDSTALQWLGAIAIFIIALAVFHVVKWISQRRLARLAAKTTSGWDDAVVEAIQLTRTWVLVVWAAYLASGALTLSPGAADVMQTLAVLTLILQSAFWGNQIIKGGLQRHAEQRLQGDPESLMTITALAFVGKLVLFAVLFLLALDNMGINVSALIAGLGIGGIAVALAVQNVLGDLLASMSIVFDKPFVPGDFIIVGDQMGTVQRIGLKTTRVASLSGEQLIFSNTDLLKSRIQNFKRMSERRVVFTVRVTYQTPRERLQQIPELLREAVTAQKPIRFDRAHFKQFAPSSLDFEIVYFVLGSEFNLYMDVQQAINFQIMERFESLGIEFAYPTQTVHLYQPSAAPDTAG